MSPSLKKILVVDDDPDILTITTYSLERLEGVTIRCVPSGEEALREALTFLPDLILLDEMMPHMDGLATLKGLRLFSQLAHVPVVFFTAKVQKNEIESFMAAGAVAVITKPFDPQTLADVVLAIWVKHHA